jgi:hypothetical protein
MGAIYGHSKVTIAAAASEDSRGGCFHENKTLSAFTYAHPTLNTSMAIRKCPDHYGYVHYSAAYDSSLPLPLFSRAWTMQEELLAPRVIYYGPHEIVFQCRNLSTCQCGMFPKGTSTAKRVYEVACGEPVGPDLTDAIRSGYLIVRGRAVLADL